jgi:DNA-binding PadR family transcriptional regulator
MALKAQLLWFQLNTRQQIYLRHIYQLDQETEQLYRHGWDPVRYGFPPPASEWRWILYGPTEPPSQLYILLRRANLVDPGTGSTFEALASRGYITRKWEGPVDEQILYVQITRQGRKLVRDALGLSTLPKKPPGQLTKSQWRCLSILRQAHRDGAKGAESHGVHYYKGQNLPWRSLLRLRDYKPEPLMREITESAGGRSRYFVQITEAGLRFYEQHKAEYEQLYGQPGWMGDTECRS